MASGVKVEPDCISCYTQLKMAKKYSYIIFRIKDNNTAIEVEKTGDPSLENPLEELHKEFIEVESKKECRYAVIDFKHPETNKPKILMINWAPDNATVKAKMIHASSKDALKKALGDGISKCLHATEISDIDSSELCKVVNSMDRA